MTAPPRPVPDPDSAPFWEALRAHELVLQRCGECKRFRFPPGPTCAGCGSRRAAFVPVSGDGRVRSWVVTHQPFHPAFADRVPYVVLLVELVEQPGLFMYGNVRPEGVAISAEMPVKAVFDDVDDGVTLLQWMPAPPDGRSDAPREE